MSEYNHLIIRTVIYASSSVTIIIELIQTDGRLDHLMQCVVLQLSLFLQQSNWRLLRSRVELMSRLLSEVHTDCSGSGLSLEAVVKVSTKNCRTSEYCSNVSAFISVFLFTDTCILPCTHSALTTWREGQVRTIEACHQLTL